jgi:MerR family transcriptional regulator, thiopeptide resistance regulator
VGRSVGEVARLAGVTVRTLHHYDEIGLLRPSGRSGAGYREYDDADLTRLQRIRAFRELGLSLPAIAEVLDDATADPIEHLRSQHALVVDRIATLREQLAAIEKTLEAHQMGIQLDPEEMFEVFSAADPTQHDEEAQRRWGETDAYTQSRRRVSSYTRDDWLRIKAETEEVERRLQQAMEAGSPPAGEQAMALAEEHRATISRWYYECDHAMHRGLAQMYLDDPRFTAHYDDRAPGLAAFVAAAIVANADRAEGSRGG